MNIILTYTYIYIQVKKCIYLCGPNSTTSKAFSFLSSFSKFLLQTNWQRYSYSHGDLVYKLLRWCTQWYLLTNGSRRGQNPTFPHPDDWDSMTNTEKATLLLIINFLQLLAIIDFSNGKLTKPISITKKNVKDNETKQAQSNWGFVLIAYWKEMMQPLMS